MVISWSLITLDVVSQADPSPPQTRHLSSCLKMSQNVSKCHFHLRHGYFTTKYKIYLDIFTSHQQKESVWHYGPIINQYPALLFSHFPSGHHCCILPLCCCPSFHHSQRACTRHPRRSADPRRRKTFHPQPMLSHISICRYKYKK